MSEFWKRMKSANSPFLNGFANSFSMFPDPVRRRRLLRAHSSDDAIRTSWIQVGRSLKEALSEYESQSRDLDDEDERTTEDSASVSSHG